MRIIVFYQLINKYCLIRINNVTLDKMRNELSDVRLIWMVFCEKRIEAIR